MLKVAYNCVVAPVSLFIGLFASVTAVLLPGSLQAEDTQKEREQLIKLAASIDELVKDTRTLLNAIPRESYQAAPILKEVGKDPEGYKEWVQENILLVPYHGALRGLSGTLMDRSGNSLDRAILLASLLELSGHKPILQRTNLTEQQVREHLLPKVLAQDLAILREQVSPVNPVDVPEELTGEAYDQTVAMMLAHQQRLENVLMRSEQHIPLLAEHLAGLSAEDKIQDTMIEALRDHWWVKIEGESPLILDPALSGVEGIHANPQFSGKAEDIPDDLYHKITARIVVEQWKAGELKQNIPLEQTWRAADIATQVITVSVYPKEWNPKVDVLNEDTEAVNNYIRDELMKQKSWLPTLVLGSKSTVQKAFNSNGELEAASEPAVATAMRGAFGALSALGNEDEDASGELTAVWQEWVLERPDGVRRVQRRMLFDWIGDEARSAGEIPTEKIQPTEQQLVDRSLALMTQGVGMVLTGEVSRPFMLARAAVSIINSSDAYKKVIKAELDRTAADLEEAMAGVELFPDDLFMWAILRHELNSARGRVYLEEPNLILKQSLISEAGNGGGLMRTGVDLVFNRVAVLSDEINTARQARLEQGVVDASLESVLMEKGEQVVYSTSNMYQQTNSSQWQTIASTTELKEQYSGLTESTQSLIRTALSEGSVVIFPPNWQEIPADTLCWWELDSEGNLLGRGAMGWGQTATDYAINLYVAKAAIMALVIGHQSCTGGSLGCWLCTIAGAAVIALGVIGPESIAVATAIGASTGGAVITLFCSVAL